VEGDLDALAVPETLHALIAARLDGLEPDERALLERAAVLGKTFTARGLARLGGLPEGDVGRVLALLVRKEVPTLDADPRSPERGQYGFLQALVQRVAYDTLSRNERRSLHLAAADHLAKDAGIDPDEIAEVIAAHLRDADRADPGAPDAAEVRACAREWLVRAGERAAALAAPVDARRAFDEAVALADARVDRALLLERAGELAYDADEMGLALDRLGEARSTFEQEGRTHDAARAAARMSIALWNLGRTDEAADLVEEAFAVLSEDEPDADVARIAAEAARIAWFRGDRETTLARVDFALDVAEAQNLPLVLSEALNTKALTMAHHPHEWRALLREALEIALEHGLLASSLRAYNNLMIALWSSGREDEADGLSIKALELARSRGNVTYTTWFAGTRINLLCEEGSWDEANDVAADLLPDVPVSQGNPALARCILAEMTLERGDREAALRHLELVAPGVSSSTDLQQHSLITYRDLLRARAEGRLDDMVEISERSIALLLDLGYDESAVIAAGILLDLSADGADRARFDRLVTTIDGRSTARRTQGWTPSSTACGGRWRRCRATTTVRSTRSAGRLPWHGRGGRPACSRACWPTTAPLSPARAERRRPGRCSRRRGPCTRGWEQRCASSGSRRCGPTRPGDRPSSARAPNAVGPERQAKELGRLAGEDGADARGGVAVSFCWIFSLFRES